MPRPRATDGSDSVTGLPVDEHLARVGHERAGQGADEGGLAGAVVADDGDDLVGVHLQVDVDEGARGAVALGHPAQREDRARSRRS